MIEMKILVIDGCHRKGNTWKITQKAMEVIKKSFSDVTYEEVVLIKENLPFCLGCSNCFRVGHNKCPHHDIMCRIIEKIDEADGVIICSSTFNWRETGVLKNMFDHLCFMLHRPYFYKGKALVIITTGGTGGKKSAKSISSTLYGIGFNRCYNTSFATYSWNDYKPSTRDIKKVSKKAAQFAKDVETKKLHSPSFIQLIPYNIMRGMGQHYTSKSEYPTEDGNWWSFEGRKKYAYFPQVKLPFYKRWFGQLFYGLGKWLGGMKFMQVSYKKTL
jgi:multimeric flavodoxin WrbA